MSKPKRSITEFRSYYLPVEFPVLVLTGEQWRISDHKSDHLHFHNYMEFGYCHDGSGTLRIRTDDLSFQTDDFTFIARNIPHTTWSSSGSKSKWSYVYADLTALFDAFAPASAYPISQMIDTINTTGLLHKKEYPVIAFYMDRIIDELTRERTHYQLSVRSLFLALLIELYRYCLETGINSVRKSSVSQDQNHTLAIVPALEYIKSNYMNQFSMESLADLCGLSPTHFRRVFNNTMGGSPLEYLNSVRITRACQLLRSTEDSILNISESVGFHSISSFNRHFDHLVNMSPRQYRKASLTDNALQDSRIVKFSGWMEPDF